MTPSLPSSLVFVTLCRRWLVAPVAGGFAVFQASPLGFERAFDLGVFARVESAVLWVGMASELGL